MVFNSGSTVLFYESFTLRPAAPAWRFTVEILIEFLTNAIQPLPWPPPPSSPRYFVVCNIWLTSSLHVRLPNENVWVHKVTNDHWILLTKIRNTFHDRYALSFFYKSFLHDYHDGIVDDNIFFSLVPNSTLPVTWFMAHARFEKFKFISFDVLFYFYFNFSWSLALFRVIDIFNLEYI
jgi:hypothetical protein